MKAYFNSVSPGFHITRGTKLRTTKGELLTFAYVADDGRIATQEKGELPILSSHHRFKRVVVGRDNHE